MRISHKTELKDSRAYSEKKDSSMKLKVNLKTGEVTRVEGEFKDLPGVRDNGQHFQLPEHVLVSAGIDHINLFHPETEAFTGHIDVSVCYDRNGRQPTFHYYSGHEEFVPVDNPCNKQGFVWLTGGLSLIMVVLAIEKYLEKEINFQPELRNAIFKGIEYAHTPALV